MYRRWNSLLIELENNRMSLFEKLNQLDPTVLNFKPDQGSWSILQVCYHLIRSEELSLQYLNKKLQFNPHIASAGIVSFLRSFTLNLILLLPFPLSAPQRVSEFPDHLDWALLHKRWVEVRMGMQKRLETIPEVYRNKLVYKHPSVGRLTIYQMLLFLKTHINRHVKQIDRIIKSESDQHRRSH